MANEFPNFPDISQPNPQDRFNKFVSAPININSAKPFLFFPFLKGRGAEKDYNFEFVDGIDGSDASSWLGTPVFDQIIIGAEENNGAENKQGITYFDPDIRQNVTVQPIVINNGLITVRQGRNIVRTKLVNASGTIKEYVSDDDFEITITGAIEHSDAETARLQADTRPLVEMQNFVRTLKATQEIPIASNYLNDVFDVTQIVITGYELGQKSGSRGLQYFNLTAISDTAKIIQQNREDITE